ncbi:MAG TPA: anti-sigma factor [Verrucomicrobiae bacterium]|nr:anti-sigma factor [Verrucomicrobiae bacterium]
MIDERMEEQAALHVSGALNEAEAREFEKKLLADPELQAYVSRLSLATGALAGTAPMVEPPPRLRAKILAQVEPPQKVLTLPEQKPGLLSWLPWAFAAGIAVLCFVFIAENNQLRNTAGRQAKQIDDLNQLAQRLQAATDTLNQTVLALQATNRLANLRIAMLNSLVPDAPKAVAVSLWDSQKQDGVFVAQNLKALPADRDYELWVIDENKPVASGVFHVGESGTIRIDFKPSQLIKVASVFAVTEEVKGGVASPTLKNMVLASK